MTEEFLLIEDLTLLTAALLVAAGVIGGFINTLAGGGSMLTLPALMMLGMPADIANATNRVGVLLQSLTGARGFYRNDRLDHHAIIPILVPTLLGSFVGAMIASYLPETHLKPVLLGSMVTMAFIMVVVPGVIAPPFGTPSRTLREHPVAAIGLFLAGAYGGFIQAGVGFILIAALAGGLRLDLVRSNALKLVCTAALSVVALGVFVVRGQVLWIPGLVLAAGTVIGASLSVRVALKVSQTALKWMLFIMVGLTCGAAWLTP